MLAIRLPKDLEERLTEMAKHAGRTKTFLAREALTLHIDDLEERYLPKKMVLCARCSLNNNTLQKSSRRRSGL